MKNISSKFSDFPVILCFLITFFVMIPIVLSYPYDDMDNLFFLLFGLVFVIFFWLTEFRTKAHKVRLQSDVFEVRKYFGLGKLNKYQISELKGYYITKQTGGAGKYEYIFIVNESKRLIGVSAFYHRNYEQLKKKIEDELLYLGEKKFGFTEEYSEMFK
ncbi:hypothetical protein LB467_12750 [Salegentibacter sp. JZCK2]|uniref:hypothetical protein n=1 Tax=Salegentibacter tibetensis TaxID=2873600 RepID=UPI001CC8FE2B|nr:hypothetical protein [Salegentibacter tibetensis]MBZ9730556.1 hypothetical protein [Salegentibacter tibetensis]